MILTALTKASAMPESRKRGLLWPRFFYTMEKMWYRPIRNILTLLRIGRMSAGILHDLMGPITALICSLELIDKTHPHAKTIRATQKNAERALTFIREQLNQQQSEPSRFAISEVVTATLQLLQYRTHQHNVRIQSMFCGKKYIYGNKMSVCRVLMNLISNAIDAHACKSDNSNNYVAVTTTATKSHMIITVSDNGCGMTKSEQRNCFRSFYTNKTSGVGIGLSVVKHIVKNELRGTITCKSTKGVGTTFTLTIPLS